MSRTKFPRLIELAAGVLFVVFSSQSAAAQTRIILDEPVQDKLYSENGVLDIVGSVSDPIGLRSVTLLVNGLPLTAYAQRGIDLREKDKLQNLKGGTTFSLDLGVPAKILNDGENDILLLTENLRGERAQVTRSFFHSPPRGTIYLAAIGINRYRDSAVPALKYAEADAHAVAAYFRDHLGVPDENIFTLVGREATKRNVENLLGVTLKRIAGTNDQIVIYYAGHGVPEFDTTLVGGDQVEKYLLPWDGEIGALYPSAIRMGEVDYLSQRYVSDRVIFLLDTCFSGSANVRSARARTLPEKAGLRSFGRQLDNAFLQRMTEATGKVVLTASGINEPSHEIDELGHGVFTYYLLEGLKGQADLDDDGIVGVLEVYKYLNQKVPESTGQNQRPDYFVSDTMRGDIVLGRSDVGSLKVGVSDSFQGQPEIGRLALGVSPPGAEISVDGIPKMTTRGFLNTELPPGRHEVTIRHPGYKEQTFPVVIEKQELIEKGWIRLEERENTSPKRLLPGAPPPP